MSCPVCGNTNLTGNTEFCPVCGTRNPEYRAPQQPVQPQYQQPQMNQQYGGQPQYQQPYNQAPQQQFQQQQNRQQYQQQQYQQAPPQMQPQYQQAPPQMQPQYQQQPPQQPPKKSNTGVIIGVIAAAVILVVGTILFFALRGGDDKLTPPTAKPTEASTEVAGGTDADTTEATTEEASVEATTEDVQINVSVEDVAYLQRPSIINDNMDFTYEDQAPSVPAQTVAPDLSDLDNHDFVDYYPDEAKQKLAENQFLVMEGSKEFFEVYESNRYDYRPNFVTVDSIMHTYHLYFAHVLKNTEKNYLTADLAKLGELMQEKTAAQLETLKGTEWETAAKINLAYFAIGNHLMNPDSQIPAEVKDTVQAELDLIEAAENVTPSPLFDDPENMEDYTQYIPRGYYDTDENLQRYFKAMMWYGRRNFARAKEDQLRSAFLMTIALDNDTLPLWEEIYTVTSFFAGASDDPGFFEYKPIIDVAYGPNVTVDKLAGNTASWEAFYNLTGQIAPPKINSVVILQTDTDEEAEAKIIGYRFMGQRFSIDETIFQNLCFRNTKENSAGDNRMLPDALDVPAAFGSDTALSILEDRGATDYKNYSENMDKMRSMVKESTDAEWNASLYSSWLNTLRPTLEVRGEGYPTYMQSEEWRKKNLTTFLGSYTELKHDTILYSKQMMAEMGGDVPPVRDDRGYVEAEPEVYARLTALVNATSKGLDSYGVLSDEDRENLALLAQITGQLQTISEKELRDELPTEAEFDFIKSYGGQLEHFWQEVNKDDAENEYFTTGEFPAAIVADVATDPNGYCLELGTGRVGTIEVIVTVDGVKKIAYGSVYSFYQFEQPISERLTDSQWRQKLGMELNDDGTYNFDRSTMPKQEDWSSSYRYEWEY